MAIRPTLTNYKIRRVVCYPSKRVTQSWFRQMSRYTVLKVCRYPNMRDILSEKKVEHVSATPKTRPNRKILPP